MNAYKVLRDRQQEEFNSIPLGFAFGQKQFDELLARWEITADEAPLKIAAIGAGGDIQKKDVPLLRAMTARHKAEMAAAIAEDQTGDGFICDMFSYELNNHEYSITYDTSDALEALGLTAAEVAADKRLQRGLALAHRQIMRVN